MTILTRRSRRFKDALSANDFDKLAGILGLDAQKLRTSEGVMDTFGTIRDRAAKAVVLTDESGRKVIEIGEELWPVPFPLSKGDNGKWAFDTYAGIEEIINRRVGENELEAIETVRAYVDAQEEYAKADHDGDGVLEYAQKLISSEGKTDGLYWPEEQGDGESPAASLVNQAELAKAKEDKGYYGYRFKILNRQGANIAGGAYDYTINGNMIAGFGLVAWPVKYGETGVHTFVVNRNGIVYQADLGEGTDAIAPDIRAVQSERQLDSDRGLSGLLAALGVLNFPLDHGSSPPPRFHILTLPAWPPAIAGALATLTIAKV